MAVDLSKVVRVQRSLIDLDSFEKVKLGKEVPFEPVTGASMLKDALARLDNDSAKLEAVINEGLKAETRRGLVTDTSVEWRSFNSDGTLNGSFSGSIGDQAKVNAFVLQMARIHGYDANNTTEGNRKAKADAISLIRNTPMILEKLKDYARPSDEEDDEAEPASE